MKTLLGKKVGMTRVYDAEGRQVPVTVLQAGPCVVIQRKTADTDGYEAVQMGWGEQKPSRISKALAGHYKKAGVTPARTVREVRVEAGEEAQPGRQFTVEIFDGVPFVDVTGISKGQGFQGVMKRHGMAGQPQAHGHTMHRRPGSIGMRERPGRILKGKRLPGHMGHVQVTTQHLRVVQVRKDDGLLLVHGSVPGPVGGLLEIRASIKKASS
ncbi:MAG: 50S ribosomal protein L3 [Kiritimatiellae bacterium]|nr:50S ribosomal protein L3 [Kiritimatiellia bacterium]